MTPIGSSSLGFRRKVPLEEVTETFDYTGGVQSLTIDVAQTVTISMWGGDGGDGGEDGSPDGHPGSPGGVTTPGSVTVLSSSTGGGNAGNGKVELDYKK